MLTNSPTVAHAWALTQRALIFLEGYPAGTRRLRAYMQWLADSNAVEVWERNDGGPYELVEVRVVEGVSWGGA